MVVQNLSMTYSGILIIFNQVETYSSVQVSYFNGSL